MPQLFGTDGVRGVAGIELTAELAFRLGRAAGRTLGARTAILARDTRLSGPALAVACAAGLAAAGCEVKMSGILPSPAVSHLVRLHQLDLGAAISASHNPPQDNGIKFYSPNGLKLSEPEEDMVEALLDGAHPPGRIGSVFPWPEAFDLYLEFLMKAAGDISLTGVRIALDCAHGATFSVAPKLYAAQGRGYP